MCTSAIPTPGKPHQKHIGNAAMKKVWVPKLAVMAKYESRTGERHVRWTAAKEGVSDRTMGMRDCRMR